MNHKLNVHIESNVPSMIVAVAVAHLAILMEEINQRIGEVRNKNYRLDFEVDFKKLPAEDLPDAGLSPWKTLANKELSACDCGFWVAQVSIDLVLLNEPLGTCDQQRLILTRVKGLEISGFGGCRWLPFEDDFDRGWSGRLDALLRAITTGVGRDEGDFVYRNNQLMPLLAALKN